MCLIKESPKGRVVVLPKPRGMAERCGEDLRGAAAPDCTKERREPKERILPSER